MSALCHFRTKCAAAIVTAAIAGNGDFSQQQARPKITA
jgi:hypothetical protein